MRRFMVQVARRALTARAVTGLISRLTRGNATVFMLHRFRDDDRGVAGHDPAQLRDALAYLRREGYLLIDLEELISRTERGERLRRAVAFTLDDGYYDQATVAGPVFAEYDCPATTFVTTGFLDGETWFWWDRITYILTSTDRRDLTVHGPTDVVRLRWASDMERAAEQARFTGWCKKLPEAAKLRAIAEPAEAAGVVLPVAPPSRYAPMTWNQLRECESGGMRFGPHTVTHPILARADDNQSEWEIRRSWECLRANAANPSPVFCYPNGQQGDFGPREFRTLETLGLRAAVVGSPGYVRADGLRRVHGSWQLPRFNWPNGRRELIQHASGVSRLSGLLRGAA